MRPTASPLTFSLLGGLVEGAEGGFAGAGGRREGFTTFAEPLGPVPHIVWFWDRLQELVRFALESGLANDWFGACLVWCRASVHDPT
jgi:hypothetical protein